MKEIAYLQRSVFPSPGWWMVHLWPEAEGGGLSIEPVPCIVAELHGYPGGPHPGTGEPGFWTGTPLTWASDLQSLNAYEGSSERTLLLPLGTGGPDDAMEALRAWLRSPVTMLTDEDRSAIRGALAGPVTPPR